MMIEVYKTLANVYEHLQDDESREIFRLRCLYSLTGNVKFLDEYIMKTSVRTRLEEAKGEKPYIFGCGVYGRTLFAAVSKDWQGFTDNNKSVWGKNICGQMIIPPHELPKDATIYLAVKWHYEEIKEQLLSHGVKKDNIINVGAWLMELSNRQYFDEWFLGHDEEETFVDVGCLNGETARNFMVWAGGQYRHIYCLEADPYNAEDCEEKMKQYIDAGKLTIIKKAATAENGVVSFQSCHNGCSKIGEGAIQVETVALDSILFDKYPTFLKMDIEGGEYDALRGSEMIISKLHPKLAISVYHLPSDIYDIPALILSYYPDYKFYLRHYSPFTEETVLYAV